MHLQCCRWRAQARCRGWRMRKRRTWMQGSMSTLGGRRMTAGSGGLADAVWPLPLGLGAVGDIATLLEFGDVVSIAVMEVVGVNGRTVSTIVHTSVVGLMATKSDGSTRTKRVSRAFQQNAKTGAFPKPRATWPHLCSFLLLKLFIFLFIINFITIITASISLPETAQHAPGRLSFATSPSPDRESLSIARIAARHAASGKTSQRHTTNQSPGQAQARGTGQPRNNGRHTYSTVASNANKHRAPARSSTRTPAGTRLGRRLAAALPAKPFLELHARV